MAQRTDEKATIENLRNAKRGVRLHKALAEMGIASRRACEQLVEEGRVTVNGILVQTLPAWVEPTEDRIEIDGRIVRPPSRRSHTYLMVHKTRGVICTNDDPQGRRRIIDLVPHPQRLFCVGRLDAESTGLVLLTDDGDLAQHLTHPKYGIVKTYEVAVRGQLGQADLERIERGIWLADKQGKAVKASAQGIQILHADREKTRLIMTLSEGKNREIRRLLARVGVKVHRLKRTAIGPLRLKGIAAGEWRELTRTELGQLRRAANATKAG